MRIPPASFVRLCAKTVLACRQRSFIAFNSAEDSIRTNIYIYRERERERERETERERDRGGGGGGITKSKHGLFGNVYSYIYTDHVRLMHAPLQLCGFAGLQNYDSLGESLSMYNNITLLETSCSRPQQRKQNTLEVNMVLNVHRNHKAY